MLSRAADAAGAATVPAVVCVSRRPPVVGVAPICGDGAAGKAVDDAPRLLYPIPGAAEARVVPVDPAADELPPPPLTVYVACWAR